MDNKKYTITHKCTGCNKDTKEGIPVKRKYSFMLHKTVVEEVACPDCFFTKEK